MPGSFQEVSDLPSNRSHDYSTASAVVFSLLRIARGLLELTALAGLLLSGDRRVVRKVLALVALRGFIGPVITRLERGIDRRFARELHAAQAQRTTERGVTPTIERHRQAGDDVAFLFEGLMDKALGWDPGRQGQGQGRTSRPRVLFLRPYAPANRFMVNLMPFTSADPEPLPKWPRLELSFFRLVHGLGATFVTPGPPDEPTGSPRTLIGEEWRPQILEEMSHCDLIFVLPFYTPGTAWEVERIFENGHLSKTLFVMPPSYLSTPIDMRVEGFWRFLLALAIRAAVGRSDPSVNYKGRRLRMAPEDPTVKGDWEVAAEGFSGSGIVLPPYSPPGAIFSYSDPAEPRIHAPLASTVTWGNKDGGGREQLIGRLREFTEQTGGNPRSIVAAIYYSPSGFGHTGELVSVILDRLEQADPGGSI